MSVCAYLIKHLICVITVVSQVLNYRGNVGRDQFRTQDGTQLRAFYFKQ